MIIPMVLFKKQFDYYLV